MSHSTPDTLSELGDTVSDDNEERLRIEASQGGHITRFEFLEGGDWKRIPFRADEWGTSWYVRDRRGESCPVLMSCRPGTLNQFEGVHDDIRFGLSYVVAGGELLVTATLVNEGSKPFAPMTAGLRLGVDSYQTSYPEWNDQLVPNVIRCEASHHWGFAMSPGGMILGWACGAAVASYSINYEPREHRIYTPSIDFLNQSPLPEHHPQHLHSVGPGEARTWTVGVRPISSVEEIKPTLANAADGPIFDAARYTIAPEEEARISIFGPAIESLTVTSPNGSQRVIHPTDQAVGRADYSFGSDCVGHHLFTALTANGKRRKGASLCAGLGFGIWSVLGLKDYGCDPPTLIMPKACIHSLVIFSPENICRMPRWTANAKRFLASVSPSILIVKSGN